MARYDRFIALAKRLIKKDGQMVVWRQILDNAAPDPNDPWLTPDPTVTDNNVYMCFVPKINRKSYLNMLSRMDKDGETQQHTISALMAQVPFTPSLKDVVIRDGIELRIDNIEVITPNGQNVIYIVEFYG